MQLPELLTRTPRRTFVLYPALVAVEQAVARRPVRAGWAPLLVWGYLQFRMAGRYRTAHGGGGPGITIPPERIVDTGIYRYTRNPMYLGHIIFLAGLAGMTRSPLAAALLAANVGWFNGRVRDDEQRLADLFGEDYLRYREEVRRWLGVPRSFGGRRPTSSGSASS